MTSPQPAVTAPGPSQEPAPLRVPARYPRTFRLRHIRTKTGCLACRSRKKKCDEAKPCCTACRRGGQNCIWPREAWPDLEASSQGKAKLSSQLLPHNGAPASRQLSVASTNAAYTLTAESGILLQHYVAVTAVLLPAGAPSQNPFITHVLPLAQNDALLLHSVLAVSGAHLAYKLPEPKDVELATNRHYLHALRGVQETISSDQLNDEYAIQRLGLVLAFLCQYEVCTLLDTDKSTLQACNITSRSSPAQRQPPCHSISAPSTRCLAAYSKEGIPLQARCPS